MDKKIIVIDPQLVKPLTNHSTLKGGSLDSRRVITNKKDGSQKMGFHVNKIVGQTTFENVKNESDEIIYFIECDAILTFDDQSQNISSGMVAFIPANLEFDISFHGDAYFLSIFSPPVE